ncbi:uncharacterized protein BJ171DRAFT_537036 [Polychytrium aggregatum]|uniref:uncharacterized protein n=1 Tax=Polychytrium aggregatum TaxID=110093 RepID=UPI0022FF2FD2|nr:uncharacterized protein BJ171DRAFT_543804 [Polychytrium aggregatum]XP_052961892.1 uncharacterized protein BJ171DRAFT_537036 [Polychytrium aggregatum]KAI9190603.1 hypothetical protein BJ171DRAFT_543804 [Polychytrium aggregatum]KAI9192954.1 hypothetical protein BJ171DRAFT_537036 [Polychytrium aggregatum]
MTSLNCFVMLCTCYHAEVISTWLKQSRSSRVLTEWFSFIISLIIFHTGIWSMSNMGLDVAESAAIALSAGGKLLDLICCRYCSEMSFI